MVTGSRWCSDTSVIMLGRRQLPIAAGQELSLSSGTSQPVVGENIGEIAQRFYRHMFAPTRSCSNWVV
jgi:hypothetical protein